MSHWTHVTGVFRTQNDGGGGYTDEEKKIHIKSRNKKLKKIVKCMEEIKDHISISYQITPIFKYETYGSYFSYEEDVVVSFFGDIRNMGNFNNEVNKLISKLWYEKGIRVKYGVVEIIGALEVDIMTYRFDNMRIEVFKDDSSNIYSLEGRIPNAKYNSEDDSITINGRKWTDEDILSNIDEFSAILDEYEIPHLIKNVNRRWW